MFRFGLTRDERGVMAGFLPASLQKHLDR